MSITFYAYHDLYGRPEFLEPDLNLANDNAALLLRWLGLESDYVGSHDAHDLKSRCLTALAVDGVFTDDGMPTLKSGGPGTGQCRMIDVGIRPGYLQEKAGFLLEICDAAIAAGIEKVTWA